jgi:hypothetical protein
MHVNTVVGSSSGGSRVPKVASKWPVNYPIEAFSQ